MSELEVITRFSADWSCSNMAASLSVQRGMWNNLNANGVPPFAQINLTIELGYTVGARVETKLLGAAA